MKQYLLTVVTPGGGQAPPSEVLEPIMRGVGALEQEMRDKGVWVFSGGLSAPSTATTLRPRGEDVLVVDGPFTEGEEYAGGFSVVKAHDLDEALEWARELIRVTGLAVEVRPFEGEV